MTRKEVRQHGTHAVCDRCNWQEKLAALGGADPDAFHLCPDDGDIQREIRSQRTYGYEGIVGEELHGRLALYMERLDCARKGAAIDRATAACAQFAADVRAMGEQMAAGMAAFTALLEQRALEDPEARRAQAWEEQIAQRIAANPSCACDGVMAREGPDARWRCATCLRPVLPCEVCGTRAGTSIDIEPPCVRVCVRCYRSRFEARLAAAAEADRPLSLEAAVGYWWLLAVGCVPPAVVVAEIAVSLLL